MSTNGRFVPKHGMYLAPEYGVWIAMLKRCRNPRNASYPRYGGRGITVCEEWHEFENFYRDMGPRPEKGYSIDRINNDGRYEPANCRWATAKQQQSNRSSVFWIDFKGERKPLAHWAKECGISRSTLRQRITHGWSAERALTTTPDKRRGAK